MYKKAFFAVFVCFLAFSFSAVGAGRENSKKAFTFSQIFYIIEEINTQEKEIIMRSSAYTFRRALPVWETGTERDMNRHLCFTVPLSPDLGNPVLALAGSCSFTVSINGQFIAHGPARCAHGYYRVDQLALTKYLTDGEGILSIRVAGYNAQSFSNLSQPSFLCAELTDGEHVIAYTAPDEGGFSAFAVEERITRVQRYSYQRPFVEHYRLGAGAFAYEYGKGGTRVSLSAVEDKQFLVRTQPYGDYPVVLPRGEVAEGTVTYTDKDAYFNDRAITLPSAGKLDGFPQEELEVHTYREVGRMDFSRTASFFCRPTQTVSLVPNSYADVDLGCNYTGILDFTVETPGGCELYILYDEFFGEDGSLDPFRLDTSNIFYYKLEPGKYHIHTCEPYTMRALRLVACGGAATVRGLKMFKVAFPTRLITARPATGDETVQKLFDAAVETFTANATDLYMDCPSRERAGWLCDSFFTGRVEKLLTGASRIERSFLENFLLPDSYGPRIPEGMLPMCYPSDFQEGSAYIPNWAMFFVLELEEYLGRTDDRAMIEAARPRVEALLAWFRQYENADGLLERLPGWVFVEWSHANDLTQDINFPTNMLYAMMKDAVARLYGIDSLQREAADLRATIRRLAYTQSGFFCDNMVYRDGVPELSGECTEVCQYYAFFSGVATPAFYPTLWMRLRDEFGFARRETGTWPQIAPANAFIGNYLRMELLCRAGETERLVKDITDYFTYMADKTGTLWEHDSTRASCNHGFASHILIWLEKAGYLVHDEE